MPNLKELIDDPGIADDEVIYRIVSWGKLPGGRDYVSVGGEAALHGNAFSDYTAEMAAEHGLASACMSVALKSVLNEHEKSAIDLIINRDDCGVAESTVGRMRSLTRADEAIPHGVMRDSKADQLWHAVVFQLSGGQRNKAVRKIVAQAFSWTIPLVNKG